MEHERAFLCQILNDNDIYFEAAPKDWWFVDAKNRAVFGAITQCILDGVNADVVTVGTKGHAGIVAEISNTVPSTANWKYYAGLCKQHGSVEELRRLSLIIADKCKGVAADPTDVITEIDNVVEKVVSGSEDFKAEKIADLIKPLIDSLEERYKNRGCLPGIATGFSKLDDMINGLERERLYVVGARPSQGKSALMLNMASVIGRTHKVGILSLESSKREILTRELSNLSGINSQRLSSGFFGRDDFAALTDAASQAYEKQIIIYDKPGAELIDVIGQCRRMVGRAGVEVIFVDYLQLIQTKADTERDRVSIVSRRLKDLTRELHVPIVALAQLRRDSDGRRPGLGDFSDSSQIEKDADTGILIWHRVVDGSGKTVHKAKAENPDESTQIYLLVEKNRDGRTGAVRVEFDAERVRFKELS